MADRVKVRRLSLAEGQRLQWIVRRGDDTLWGVNREHKGTENTLKALRSIRAVRPDDERSFIIMDNLLRPYREADSPLGTEASCGVVFHPDVFLLG